MKKTKTVEEKITLTVYRAQWEKLSVKKNLVGKEAIEAVKRNGDALMYVKDQTQEVCIEAVKRNGYALRYVQEELFEEKK